MDKRPKIVPGKTNHINLAACGEYDVTVTYHNGKIYEVFTRLSNTGSCLSSFINALSVSVTIGLRSGANVEDYIDKLKDIKCPSVTFDEGCEYTSCADALAKFLEEMNQWLKENPQPCPTASTAVTSSIPESKMV